MWLSVSKNPPKNGESYIIKDLHGTECIAIYIQGHDWDIWRINGSVNYVYGYEIDEYKLLNVIMEN